MTVTVSTLQPQIPNTALPPKKSITLHLINAKSTQSPGFHKITGWQHRQKRVSRPSCYFWRVWCRYQRCLSLYPRRGLIAGPSRAQIHLNGCASSVTLVLNGPDATIYFPNTSRSIAASSAAGSTTLTPSLSFALQKIRISTAPPRKSGRGIIERN